MFDGENELDIGDEILNSVSVSELQQGIKNSNAELVRTVKQLVVSCAEGDFETAKSCVGQIVEVNRVKEVLCSLCEAKEEMGL